MPAAAPTLTLTIRGDSPLARKLARASRRHGADPARLAAAALETMLGCMTENPDTGEAVAHRAAKKALASQLLGG